MRCELGILSEITLENPLTPIFEKLLKFIAYGHIFSSIHNILFTPHYDRLGIYLQVKYYYSGPHSVILTPQPQVVVTLRPVLKSLASTTK